ncbi:hypothetical protein DCAR_0519148 [Daucus carota subsp. sativus]|uniref:JmjC domain-containing protein n=1 Tax=Daucus carota subsp. sativus TaxID=79200 RepID=A0A161ZYR5_DAUCS|nr:hypothetical protein DCAR_0519148 [Daucus carota subsp. sativus]
MTVGETAWNMREVSRSDGSLLKFVKKVNPGVTSPMVYSAILFDWLAWHVEDHDLHILNYMHMGVGETWYSMVTEAAPAFEDVERASNVAEMPIWASPDDLKYVTGDLSLNLVQAHCFNSSIDCEEDSAEEKRQRQIVLGVMPSRRIICQKISPVRAACILVALHPSNIASALVEGNSDVSKGLEWIRTWALHVAESDRDRNCNTLDSKLNSEFCTTPFLGQADGS